MVESTALELAAPEPTAPPGCWEGETGWSARSGGPSAFTFFLLLWSRSRPASLGCPGTRRGSQRKGRAAGVCRSQQGVVVPCWRPYVGAQASCRPLIPGWASWFMSASGYGLSGPWPVPCPTPGLGAGFVLRGGAMSAQGVLTAEPSGVCADGFEPSQDSCRTCPPPL